MAFWDDWTLTAAGALRHASGTTHYTTLEVHRALALLSDDEAASGNDIHDISFASRSERITDQIINLLNGCNIDDAAAEYIYGGSISQDGGNTLYSGLKVLGAVDTPATQLEVIQDHAFYDTVAPFWGTQASGGYNGDATAGVLMRVLIKTRYNGADVDGKRVRVQARHWGDTYDFFNVTLGTGESVAAIGTTPDPQNTTLQATVTAWTHVLNSGGTANAPTGGYQTIDINDGNGAQPYYSKWTFGADPPGTELKGVWEYLKDLTGNGTAKTCDGIAGEFFLGITHSFAYDNEAGGPFTERETVVWGTDVTYDNLAGGTFDEGDYVVFKRATVIINAGKVVYDNGTTQMRVALESTSVSLQDGDQIVEASAGTVTADINVTITNNDKGGGEGILLALDDDGATGNMYLQLISGVAPVNNLPLRGITSTATCDVNLTVTARTVPKVFLGSYTGSLIGAYGVGIDADDLGYPDTVQDLDGDTNNAPNNVTFTVSGLVSGEDRLLVGPKDPGASDFDWDQLTLTATLNGAGVTSFQTDEVVPANTPTAGYVRITLDDGRHRRVQYTSWTSGTPSTWNIPSTDFTDPNDATLGNGVMVAYIDKLATATEEAYTTVFASPQTLWVRDRDGGVTPIKPFDGQASLSAGGGSSVVSRISDA